MKKLYLLIFILTTLSRIANGQAIPDSVLLRVKAIDASRHDGKLDSLSKAPQSVTTKADSISNQLQSPIDSANTKIASLQNSLRSKIDSLKAKGQPSPKLQQRLDSLEQMSRAPQEQLDKVGSLQQKLEQGVRDKVPGTDTLSVLKTNVEEKVNSVNQVSTELGIGPLGKDLKPNVNANLPGLPDTGRLPGDVPGLSPSGVKTAPGTPTLPDATLNTPNLKVPEIKDQLPGEIGELQGKAGELQNTLGKADELTKEADAYSKEIKTIQQEGLTKSEKLPELAEQQLMKVDEVQAFQQEQLKATGQLTDYQKLIEQYKNEEAIKVEMKEKVREVANDILDQYQEKISADMKIISKQARKLSKIKEVRSLSRASGSIKGQGWRDRIVPGFVMQTLGGTKVWLQINPQVYYKINGNWSAGLGAMYRFSMNPDRLTFHDFENLYGGNVFVQSYFFKGFFLRAEAQRLSWQPWDVHGKDPDYRAKTSVAAIGLGKSYFIAKTIKANVQTLYHFNWGGADPYPSKIMIRFGFDFSLKKKEVKPWEKKLKELKKAKN